MAEKKLWLRNDQIRPLLPDGGACVVSDRIMVDGQLVGYMYREESAADVDTGWRFLAGDESPEYIEDSSKHGVYAVNVVANHDTAILPLLDAPVGIAFARDWETFWFQPEDMGEESS